MHIQTKPRDHNFSRFTPCAEVEDCTVAGLFKTIRAVKHCTEQPSNESEELTLTVEHAFGGWSLYVTPCDQLKDLLTRLSIYGEPHFADVYLRVNGTSERRWFLGMQFQQIIGSYVLFELPNEVGEQLTAMYSTGEV